MLRQRGVIYSLNLFAIKDEKMNLSGRYTSAKYIQNTIKQYLKNIITPYGVHTVLWKAFALTAKLFSIAFFSSSSINDKK